MYLPRPPPNEAILLATAFAAGAVDVISFGALGGVFASAMTGNFALLAYYMAKGDAQSAIGSIVALSGFVLGCALGVLQRRGRPRPQGLLLLLSTEAGLLAFFAFIVLLSPGPPHSASDHLNILLLAAAMGFQAVLGQTISQTTIVFTTTLTRLVGTVADAVANRDSAGLTDVRIQVSVVVAYLFGALLAGALIVHDVALVALVPLIGVAGALAVHLSRRVKA